ncbi:hypothetical protein SEA_PHLOP_81 [Gordonia phage Phlop]|uniref:Uncharacterized protein n=10 Tax=Wizardvirus TaxID=2169658 RepID=A0A4Y5U0I0_9CAUD|nr:hypothetical protein KNU09_gp82 [Gordonia phage TillyBobJoe]YP_010102047.1 hypothetical protein KNU53_gp85 [Gordonia phage SmokingBunny]YP_010102143.1 hypothetical protein KNU54_gp86 [Gordonia phage VanDeWege]YP_010102335.1 hypothetical protein KNU56_gp84 [Gordonia phage Arri]YP_010102430.1 hypothetical protein KNU57_gp85 [Gordonia phage Valary]YP_010103097.1 hypothetical protein KNU63_gp87 [Gordonia phage RogerDodger]YP_010104301.1 hypothetical protein KNU74_gp87 [Gordonia phage Fireball]
MTAVVIPPAVWVHGRLGSWMIVDLDAGQYLSLSVTGGVWLAELCGPDDAVIERRQGRGRSGLHARAAAVRAARELRAGGVA